MPLISTHDLTRTYPGVTALDRLSVDVEPGIVGLVGANGAGKTTLIKVLLGLLPPTSGSASVMGLDVAHHGVEIRQFVGYMPEHDCLPPDLSATDFVAHMARMSGLPATAARERTAEVLRHVGLYEERYRPIGGYSTGMKQRVKLAQALVHDPRLLLLDEPTNGLDPAGREDMLDLVKRTGTDFGIAVVVASHLLGEIEQVCDFLLAIDAGRLLQFAPMETFTRRTGVLTVETDEPGDRLAARLVEQGFRARPDGHLVHIALAGDLPYDAVVETLVELDLPLIMLEQGRHRLEDLFRETDEAPPIGGAAEPGAAEPAAAEPAAAEPGASASASATAGGVG